MTYQLHLGIGEDLEEFLRAFATARSITIAAAVRILLYDAREDELLYQARKEGGEDATRSTAG